MIPNSKTRLNFWAVGVIQSYGQAERYSLLTVVLTVGFYIEALRVCSDHTRNCVPLQSWRRVAERERERERAHM
jgi:hypothetical protein